MACHTSPLPLRPMHGALVVLCAQLLNAHAVHADDLDVLPSYETAEALNGQLSLAGTDSMAPMLRRWVDFLRVSQRGVEFRLETGAPPTAAAALASGTAAIGYTGRTLFESEIETIVRTRGQAPQSFRVGAGAFNDRTKTHTMAVFIHADNPLRQLSLPQIRQLYSAKSQRMTWGEIGVMEQEWHDRPIRTLVAKLGTGATNFVREVALGGAEWSRMAEEFPTDEAAVDALSLDPYAICIGGLSYRAGAARPVALSAETGGPSFQPTREHVISRRYPLARVLYLHFVPSRTRSPDPLTREFLKFALSKEGQTIVLDSGYLPLTGDIVRAELSRLDACCEYPTVQPPAVDTR